MILNILLSHEHIVLSYQPFTTQEYVLYKQLKDLVSLVEHSNNILIF